MRVITGALAGLAVGLSLLLGVILLGQEGPRLFTVTTPADRTDPKLETGERKLTDKEVRDAVQTWYNDRDHPLKILKVDVKNQDIPDRYLVYVGYQDWHPATVDPYTHPGLSRMPLAVPVTYALGDGKKTRLFIIDNGGVVDCYENFKRPRR